MTERRASIPTRYAGVQFRSRLEARVARAEVDERGLARAREPLEQRRQPQAATALARQDQPDIGHLRGGAASLGAVRGPKPAYCTGFPRGARWTISMRVPHGSVM